MHNQIEVVTYTAVNNKCEMQEIAIVFQRRGGLVFSVTPFFLVGGGGGGGSLKAAAGGRRDGWVTRGGEGLFLVKNFDVDSGWGEGGVDEMHHQGVWGWGAHGWVMAVHKSLMSDV